MKYDPKDVQSWLKKQRLNVIEYVTRQPIKHGGVAEEADWYLDPYISIWRVASGLKPNVLGWWAISGDLPTDYLSGKDARNAREALRAFAKLWDSAARMMLEGKEHPQFRVGTPENRTELGDLLLRRAGLLAQFADDDSIWS